MLVGGLTVSVLTPRSAIRQANVVVMNACMRKGNTMATLNPQIAEKAAAQAAESSDDLMDAKVVSGICRFADKAKHPQYFVPDENGDPIRGEDGEIVYHDPLYVRFIMDLPEPVEFSDEVGTETVHKGIRGYFNISGKIIEKGGDLCKWNDKQTAERSFYYLDLIGWDFEDNHAVEGADVRVRLGRDDRDRVIADVITHTGAQHDEAAGAAGADAARAAKAARSA